jgi:hypothetical protein
MGGLEAEAAEVAGPSFVGQNAASDRSRMRRELKFRRWYLHRAVQRQLGHTIGVSIVRR